MTLSRKQKIIIWVVVLFIVLVAGLDNRETITPDRVNYTTRYYAYFYGITLLDGLVEPNFFYHVVRFRFRLILAALVIGAAGFMTLKKKT